MAFVAYVPPADSAGPFRYPARLGRPQQRPPRPTGPSLREGYVVLPLLATMTRSADLDDSPGLPRDRLVIPGALPDDLVWAAIETVPTLSHSPLSACQCLYAGGIDGCTGPDPSPSSSPSPSKGGLGSLITLSLASLTGPRFDASSAFAHAPARRVARLSTRPTPFGAAETFTPELSSPQVTPRRSRVSLRSCLDSCCDGTCIRWESAVMGCNFAPRALPRLLATSGPSATLSSSADFPGAPVIRPTLLRRFRGGTRRASPVAAPRVLVTVPSLPPRRRGVAASARLRRSLLPSRGQDTLGLRSLAFSRLPLRSLMLRPGNSLTILPMASSMGSRGSVSLRPAIQATGRLALVPVGLPPTEHVCLWIAPCPSPKLHPVGKWLIDQL